MNQEPKQIPIRMHSGVSISTECEGPFAAMLNAVILAIKTDGDEIHIFPLSVDNINELRALIDGSAEVKYSAYLPIEWRFGDDPSDGIGGPPVEDAGTIYVSKGFPVDVQVDEDIFLFRTSISELVSEAIDGWKCNDGFIDKDHEKQSDDLAACLRASADMLDSAKRHRT